MIAIAIAVGITQAALKPAWTSRVGGYHLVKWARETADERTIETLFLKDRQGRVVGSVTDFRVTPLFRNDPPEVRDLNHDGVPEVILTTWTGGAHGSNTFHIWSLGKHPRCLLAYDKNNISDQHDFDFVDLDRDGIPEIRSWYDGFAYTVGASDWQYLPVVLKLVNGRYVDRTSHFPKLLKQAAAAVWKELPKTDLKAEPGLWSGPASCAVNLIALADLTHSRPAVWRKLKGALPPKTYAWLREREPQILTIARARRLRYAYPTPYSPKPVTFPQSAALTKAWKAFDQG